MIYRLLFSTPQFDMIEMIKHHSRLIYCMCGNEIESKSEFNTTDSYNGATTIYIQTEKTSLVHPLIFVRLLKGMS